MKLVLSLKDKVDGIIFQEDCEIDFESPEIKKRNCPIIDIIFKAYIDTSARMIESKKSKLQTT